MEFYNKLNQVPKKVSSELLYPRVTSVNYINYNFIMLNNEDEYRMYYEIEDNEYMLKLLEIIYNFKGNKRLDLDDDMVKLMDHKSIYTQCSFDASSMIELIERLAEWKH